MFQGFPPRGLRFLRELEKHNDRAWFAARKKIYQEDLLAPMQALVMDLSDRFARKRIPIFGDVRRSIFRIYRDVRFTHDKRPYKAHMSAYLSPDGGRHTPGGLYIHVAHESFLSLAFYDLDRTLLSRWRFEMAEHPKDFQDVVRALGKSRLRIIPPEEEEDSLARLPRGFAHMGGKPLEPYFRLRHFLVHEDLTPLQVAARGMLERAVRFVERCLPLLAYGWRLASQIPDSSEERFLD